MTSTPTTLPRPLRLALIAVVALFFCGVALSGGLLFLYYRTPAPINPVLAAATDTIPPFTLVDQDGKPITQDHLKGHITVLQFMFTSCPLACPAMTNQMQAVQKRLQGVPGVQFVSISFDPAHDTPAALKEYASQRFKVDESNWRFLTEPPGSLAATGRSIYTNDLHQHFEIKGDDPISANGGGQMYNINHSVNLFLIAPDGSVMAIYNSLHPDEMNALVNHALQATKQLK